MSETKNTQPIDEGLMRRRRILSALPDPEGGLGWVIELECGHTIWCAVRPMNFVHCGACLGKLIEEVRALQAKQARPAKET